MKEVKIGTKVLKASWNRELASDLSHFHGLNVEEQLTNILRSERIKRTIIKIWKSKN